MNSADFLALIKQGADAWNRWRRLHPHDVPNLDHAYLFECVLDRFDLSDVSLGRACLIGASFREANLQRANLKSVYASSTHFTNANLTEATLSHGIFSEADFTQANLQQAIALGTNFSNACFERAKMLEWQVDETTVLEDRKGVQRTTGSEAKRRDYQTILNSALVNQKSANQRSVSQKSVSQRSEGAIAIDQVTEGSVAAKLAQLFQPDGAEYATPGLFHQSGYLQKIEAYRAMAIAQIEAKRRALYSLQTDDLPIPQPIKAAALTQKAKRAAALARRYPLPMGVSAIALCTTLIISARDNASPAAGASPLALTPPVIDLPCHESPPPDVSEWPVTHEYDSGARFYGTFLNGQPADGRATLLYPTGNRYDGEYRSGRRHGCGTFSFADGRRYVGEMRADSLEGKGTWIMANGERYIGEFENNQCSGEGTFIFVNGASQSGVWANGRLIGTEIACDRGTLDLPTSLDL